MTDSLHTNLSGVQCFGLAQFDWPKLPQLLCTKHEGLQGDEAGQGGGGGA